MSGDSIELTGSTLEYWFEASGLINTLAEIEGITEESTPGGTPTLKPGSTLTLKREMFKGAPGGDTDWRLLKDLVEMRKIGNLGRQGLINRFDASKGYSKDQVTNFLDYIMFKTARTALPNLARELQVAPHGALAGEQIAVSNRARPVGNAPAPRVNGHWNNNNGYGYGENNNYNNNNYEDEEEEYFRGRRQLERNAEEEELGKYASAASKFLRRTNRNNNNNRPPKGKRRGGRKTRRGAVSRRTTRKASRK